jgi:adenine-specific DNA methylase/REP element-mobilizing transposase RayT
VDFPVAEVSRHSAREKSIRHGHPSTLHLWWARRPLAACRAMLMALLLPDPCDENCPAEFKEEARHLLKPMPNCGATGTNKELRDALLKFIADFANWDNSAKPAYLECARGLVRAAHLPADRQAAYEPPLVVDPFAGGGSIPLEALRVGCDAFASDLNPVACLILKVLLEDIPRYGPALAEELRRVGKEIKEQAEKELAEFYPVDPDGSRPIAYLWARTVRCEAVGCGAEIPLMRSFWLCKKANRRRALRLKVVKPCGTGFQPVVSGKMPEPQLQPVRSFFQGVNPWKSQTLSVKSRNLPHLQVPEATYFVTYRCRGGFALPEAARDIALAAIRHWDGKRIDLDAAVVMPEHVHAIFRIVDGSSLSEILHSIKSYSSNQINKLLGRKGALWLDESFDHVVRNGMEWEEKAQYIWQNPVTKELVRRPEEYPWLYLKGHRQDACATSTVGAPGGSGFQPESIPRVEFEIYEPKSEAEVRGGTVNRGNAVCPCCNTVLPVARVRAQLSAQRGGADVQFEERKSGTGILPVRIAGARLLAVVTLDENKSGRQYRLPTERDYAAVWKAQKRLRAILAEWKVAQASRLRDTGKMPVPLCPVPDEPLPPQGTLGFRVQLYGMREWGDLFTARQKLALLTLAALVREHKAGSSGTSGAVANLLGLALGRSADQMSTLVRWLQTIEAVASTFGRQALPIVWDCCEICPTGEEAANFGAAFEWIARVVEASPACGANGQSQIADAGHHPLPNDVTHVWFTDPPYYDAVPYADLSDFFYVWLRRTLPDHPLVRNPFESGNPLTPKCPEIVQDEVKHTPEGRPKDKAFFEESMQKAFAEGRRILREDGVASVVFAHKTTEGWEALISGMLKGGWTATASWPLTTERSVRLRARESAALAASVHLVCRPRPKNAGIGSWEEVLHALPGRIGNWMERLSGEGIRGADLVFSCIGPALELFSKYDKVETAEGREVKLDEFLEKVWEVVGRTALQQILGTAEARARNSAAGALEEDARLTALFLWTLQSTNNVVESRKSKVENEDEEEEVDEDEEGSGKAKKGYVLIYDVVRRFAQPLGIHLQMWEGRIIETKKGVVRLIPVLERTEQLFGEAGTEAAALAIERSGGREPQYALFPEPERSTGFRGTGFQPVKGKGKGDRSQATGKMPVPQVTTLDRVHMAMLLQAGGQATALRAMLEAEIQRSPDFLRLANALSALYPKQSEEKRLLDAMLLAVPR